MLPFGILFFFLMLFPLGAQAQTSTLPASLTQFSDDFKMIQISLERQKMIQFYHEGKYDEAIQTADAIAETMEGLSDKILAADIFDDIARIYQVKGVYEKAENFYLKALENRKASFGKKHPSNAKS